MAVFPFGKEKTAPQNSDRIRMDCTETLELRHGSSLKYSVERPCGYQGDILQAGSVRLSHESLQKKLLVPGYEVLHWVIDNDALLNEPEIVHTNFWIPIVNMKVALY